MATSELATVLVVDNDAALRSLVAEVLDHEGYRVLEAGNGVRTIRLLAQEQVDVLLLDVRLDLEDGVALGRELRLDWPDIPIALMSGDSSAVEAMGRAVGLTDLFLSKPFTPENLTATVEELLARRAR